MAEVREPGMEDIDKPGKLQSVIQDNLERVPPGNRLLERPSTGMSTGDTTSGADMESLGQHHSSGHTEEQDASRGTQEPLTEGTGDWSASAEGRVSVTGPSCPETPPPRQQRREAREAVAQMRVSHEMADSLMTAIIGEISTQAAVASKRDRMAESGASRPVPGAESVASFGSNGGYPSLSRLQSFVAGAEDQESMRRLLGTVIRDAGKNLPEGVLSSAVDRKAPPTSLPSGEANIGTDEDQPGAIRPPSNCSMASFNTAGQGVCVFEDWLAGLGEISKEVLQEICEHLDKNVFPKIVEAPEDSSAEATPAA